MIYYNVEFETSLIIKIFIHIIILKTIDYTRWI